MSLHNAAVLAFAAIVVLTGCAGVARSPAAATSECSELDTEIATKEEAKRRALQRQQVAWKAVIPLAVAAEYAGAKSAAADADKRLLDLRGEFARLGCGPGTES
jgi:hypothetical protein